MKIALDNFRFVERTGTELFVLETATELRRRGHTVAIMAPLLGPLAGVARRAGIEVTNHPRELSFEPEVIHSNSRVGALGWSEFHPEVPTLGHLHSGYAWSENSVRHPSLRRLLFMAAFSCRSLERRLGLEPRSMGWHEGGVDLEQFPRRAEIPERPRRAILFNRYQPQARHRQRLSEACDALGIELDFLDQLGDELTRPGELMRCYDIVFASGRSAREAICSGCAVFPTLHETTTAMVTPANYAFARWRAFCAPNLRRPSSQESLIEKLSAYDAGQVAQVCEQTRRDFDLRTTVSALEGEYRVLPTRPVIAPDYGDAPPGLFELGAEFLEQRQRQSDLATRTTELAAKVTELVRRQRPTQAKLAAEFQKKERWRERCREAEGERDELRRQLDERDRDRSRSWWPFAR